MLSLSLPTKQLPISLDRHPVDAVVLCMPAVAGDAGVFHLMAMQQLIQSLPQFSVLQFRELRPFLTSPAVGLPLSHPLAETFADVDAVGEQLDVRGALELLQAANHGHEFHSVVGGQRFAARLLDLLAGRGVTENERPTSGAGIAAARAVGEELDLG